jgi:hypothetical protein
VALKIQSAKDIVRGATFTERNSKMLTPQHDILLKKLEELLRTGILTKTDRVASGTFVCLTQETPFGLAYHQGPVDTMPADLYQTLKDAKVGDRIGSIKVIAIYDIWAVDWENRTPPVKAFDN